MPLSKMQIKTSSTGQLTGCRGRPIGQLMAWSLSDELRCFPGTNRTDSPLQTVREQMTVDQHTHNRAPVASSLSMGGCGHNAAFSRGRDGTTKVGIYLGAPFSLKVR